MFDDETQRLLGQKAAQADQLDAASAETAARLANFRTQLVCGGFSTHMAEDLCRDWFGFLLDKAEADADD